MSADLVPTDSAWPYLGVQRGSLSAMIDDRAGFWAHYLAQLDALYRNIAPHLPAGFCNRVVDIGGGMGGIDILLSRHWRERPEIVIVDGTHDKPEMEYHSKTFSNAEVASAFLAANGVVGARFLHPAVFTAQRAGMADLVVSFQAWGFHVHPHEYLANVKRILRPSGRLILDVRDRRQDREWKNFFLRDFRHLGAIHEAEKFTRHVWEPKE